MSENEEPKITFGWGWPSNSKKAHLFSHGQSLCLKWLYTGKLTVPEPAQEKRRPDDCADCHKRYWKNAQQLAKKNTSAV